MTIDYRCGTTVSTKQVVEFYKRSGSPGSTSDYRPETSAALLKNANLVVTAWDEDRLVGIARTLTDFQHIAYIADVVVDPGIQHEAIGRRLVREIKNRLGGQCIIVLNRGIALS